MKAQAAAASMESSSQVPAQTTQIIPPQPSAAAPSAAAPSAAAPSAATPVATSASDDLLALDSNPFQAKADNVLSVQAGMQSQPAWNNQNLLDPMCKYKNLLVLMCLNDYLRHL